MTKPGANADAVAALWAEGLTVPVIAERLGMTVATVKKTANRHRDRCPARKPGRGPAPSPEFVDRAARMWVEGYSATEIAAALGTSRNAVLGLTWRNRERFPLRVGAASGEAGPAPARADTISRITIRGVSLPAMSWDRHEPPSPSPSD